MYFSWIPDHLFQDSPVAVPINRNASTDSETLGLLFTRLFYKPMRNAPCTIFSRINRNRFMIVNYCCVIWVLHLTMLGWVYTGHGHWGSGSLCNMSLALVLTVWRLRLYPPLRWYYTVIWADSCDLIHIHACFYGVHDRKIDLIIINFHQ